MKSYQGRKERKTQRKKRERRGERESRKTLRPNQIKMLTDIYGWMEGNNSKLFIFDVTSKDRRNYWKTVGTIT